jgi:hypothetical protein
MAEENTISRQAAEVASAPTIQSIEPPSAPESESDTNTNDLLASAEYKHEPKAVAKRREVKTPSPMFADSVSGVRGLARQQPAEAPIEEIVSSGARLSADVAPNPSDSPILSQGGYLLFSLPWSRAEGEEKEEEEERERKKDGRGVGGFRLEHTDCELPHALTSSAVDFEVDKGAFAYRQDDKDFFARCLEGSWTVQSQSISNQN